MAGYWGNVLTRCRRKSLLCQGQFSNKLLKSKCLKRSEGVVAAMNLGMANFGDLEQLQQAVSAAGIPSHLGVIDLNYAPLLVDAAAVTRARDAPGILRLERDFSRPQLRALLFPRLGVRPHLAGLTVYHHRRRILTWVLLVFYVLGPIAFYVCAVS